MDFRPDQLDHDGTIPWVSQSPLNMLQAFLPEYAIDF